MGSGNGPEVEPHNDVPTERDPSTTMRFFLRRLAVGMADEWNMAQRV